MSGGEGQAPETLVHSERFLERTQVDFLRPCGTRLAMNLPISFRDRVDVEETILPTFLDQGRRTVAQAFAIDAAVDHDMGYMDAEWPILARHALRNHAQASFGCRKMSKSRFAANARRSAGENDAAAPKRDEPARCFAPNQEAAEAADAPEILELLRGQLAEVDALIVARVRHDELRRIETIARGHRPLEQFCNVALAGRIHRDWLGTAARRCNRLRDSADLGPRSSRHEDVIATLG